MFPLSPQSLCSFPYHLPPFPNLPFCHSLPLPGSPLSQTIFPSLAISSPFPHTHFTSPASHLFTPHTSLISTHHIHSPHHLLSYPALLSSSTSHLTLSLPPSPLLLTHSYSLTFLTPTLLTSPLFHIHTPPLTHLPFSLFISPSHPPFLSLTSSHPLSPLAYLPFPTCYRTLTLSTRLLTLSVPTSPESHPAPHPIPLQSTPLASPIISHLLTPTHSLNLPLHTPLSYLTCLVCIPTHSHLSCTNNLFCTNDIK